MKTFFTLFLSCLALAILDTSCSKACNDPNALNYELEQSTSDRCIYPQSFSISSIGLKSYPVFDASGNQWDSEDSPELFVKVFDANSGDVLYTTSEQFVVPVTWKVSEEITLDIRKTVLRFEVYKQDDNQPVLMDQVEFTAETLTVEAEEVWKDLYPETLFLTGINGSTITTSLNWTE